jgi:hypothetical protein
MRPLAFPAFRGVAAAVLITAAACGEPPRDGRAAAFRVARPMCEAACDRLDRCGDDDAPLCDCERARDTGAFRADWAAAAIACARDAPCDADVDCDLAASRAIGIRPLDQPGVVLRCLAKGDTCGGSFAMCRRLAALTDDARNEVDRCAALDCDRWRACFATFWRARVAPSAPVWR